MKSKIDLPDGGAVTVGHDHALGFFCTLVRGTHRYDYDALTEGYERPLQGLLHWLVVRDVFSEDDLDEALLAYADDIDDEPLSPGAALALQVIEALKAAASQ